MSYSVLDTPSGAKTLVMHGARDLRLHSAHDPVKEAERSVAPFDPGKKNYIVIAGLALGYHVAILARRFPDTALIVIERDFEVTGIALRENSLLPKRMHIIHTIDDLSSVFEAYDISEFRGLAVYTHRPSYQIDPQFYDSIITEMNRYVSSKISDLLTRFEFEEKWALNIIKNIPLIFTSHHVHNYFGAFKGYPGIIVSAGPSLKKNAHHLRGIQDKALICCVDTSYKVLDRMDIHPHIVMALDSQKHSIRHFLGLRSHTPHLLSDMVSYHRVAQCWKGPIILSTTAKYFNDAKGIVQRAATPLMDWVERHAPSVGDIQSGGSVATSLFDFLLNAGCDPIILIGQDLAYTGREIHTSGTYHNDEWLTLTNRTLNLDTINQRVVRKRKISFERAWGNKGTVLTDFVLNLYRQWFEDSARKVPCRVINATEGGAHIENTVELTLRETVDSFTVRKQTPDQIIETIGKKNKPHSSKQFIAACTELRAMLEPCSHIQSQTMQLTEQNAALAVLSNADTAMALAPFLKKTNAYLNRHPDMEKDRSDALIARDIVRAAHLLIPQLDECMRTITQSQQTII